MRRSTLREQLAAADARAAHWQEAATHAFAQRDATKDGLYQRVMEAEAFIRDLGYRRCDILACNCNSWHKWTL